MTTREIQVTFDCGDPAALAAFWCEVLGYAVEAPPEGFATWPAFLESVGVPEPEWSSRSAARPLEGHGPRLFFQRVPEGKTAKNRVHLDVRAAPGLKGAERLAALDAEAARLVALGASVVLRQEPDGLDEACIWMNDPEGNDFCLD
ncbi:VOC family protein [Nocardioides aequoreus]|uniref:VOC family protein n=1 Tax=Nocardioides aequoreus TaxID=397278 RepID=UPI0004C3B7D9|nr:VOC family protein [Nocardioides aequoreus]